LARGQTILTDQISVVRPFPGTSRAKFNGTRRQIVDIFPRWQARNRPQRNAPRFPCAGIASTSAVYRSGGSDGAMLGERDADAPITIVSGRQRPLPHRPASTGSRWTASADSQTDTRLIRGGKRAGCAAIESGATTSGVHRLVIDDGSTETGYFVDENSIESRRRVPRQRYGLRASRGRQECLGKYSLAER